MSNTLNWGCCSDSGEDLNYVKCSHCNYAFHYACLPTEPGNTSGWKCPNCSGKKRNQDDTPVRSTTAKSAPIAFREDNCSKRSAKRPAVSSPQAENSSTDLDDRISKIVRSVVQEELENIVTQISSSVSKAIQSEIKVLRSEVLEMKNSMTFLNDKYEEFKSQQTLAIKSMESLKVDNVNMMSAINTLTHRVNILEQQARACNIEIQCVPEKRTEDLYSIVASISKVIRCQISSDDIVRCTRVAKIKPDSSRPRSIVVQMNSTKVRDQFLAAAFAYNKLKNKNEEKLNTTDIGIQGGKSPIFISEHLAPGYKALHAAARSKAKEKKYKFVWVRNGKIFVRKDEQSDYILIRDNLSLDKII